MGLRNAFADLVTEPIARRLNIIVGILAPLGLVVDKTNSTLRLGSVNVGTVTTLPTVTAVTTVTTVTSVTNIGNIGGSPASNMVSDSMATRWATSIRPRIT